jgi:hypothetical protein
MVRVRYWGSRRLPLVCGATGAVVFGAASLAVDSRVIDIALLVFLGILLAGLIVFYRPGRR